MKILFNNYENGNRWVRLAQRANGSFAVVTGNFVRGGLTREEATVALGEALLNVAERDGKLVKATYQPQQTAC